MITAPSLRSAIAGRDQNHSPDGMRRLSETSCVGTSVRGAFERVLCQPRLHLAGAASCHSPRVNPSTRREATSRTETRCSRPSSVAIWIGAGVVTAYVVASGVHGSAWTAAAKDILLLSVAVLLGLYLPIHLYDAGHGFVSDRSKDYDADSARLARLRTLQLFQRSAGSRGEH